MRLTWRDGAASVLAGLVIALLVGVEGWAWPVTGGDTMAVGVLAVLGIVMCSLGMQITDGKELLEPMPLLGCMLGTIALGLVVYGLLIPSESLFVALAVILLALWAVTTVDHARAETPHLRQQAHR